MLIPVPQFLLSFCYVNPGLPMSSFVVSLFRPSVLPRPYVPVRETPCLDLLTRVPSIRTQHLSVLQQRKEVSEAKNSHLHRPPWLLHSAFGTRLSQILTSLARCVPPLQAPPDFANTLSLVSEPRIRNYWFSNESSLTVYKTEIVANGLPLSHHGVMCIRCSFSL